MLMLSWLKQIALLDEQRKTSQTSFSCTWCGCWGCFRLISSVLHFTFIPTITFRVLRATFVISSLIFTLFPDNTNQDYNTQWACPAQEMKRLQLAIVCKSVLS